MVGCFSSINNITGIWSYLGFWYNCVPVIVGLDHEPKNPKNLEAFFFRGIFGRKARKRNKNIIDKQDDKSTMYYTYQTLLQFVILKVYVILDSRTVYFFGEGTDRFVNQNE
jgi:hypothetical protein